MGTILSRNSQSVMGIPDCENIMRTTHTVTATSTITQLPIAATTVSKTIVSYSTETQHKFKDVYITTTILAPGSLPAQPNISSEIALPTDLVLSEDLSSCSNATGLSPACMCMGVVPTSITETTTLQTTQSYAVQIVTRVYPTTATSYHVRKHSISTVYCGGVKAAVEAGKENDVRVTKPLVVMEDLDPMMCYQECVCRSDCLSMETTAEREMLGRCRLFGVRGVDLVLSGKGTGNASKERVWDLECGWQFFY